MPFDRIRVAMNVAALYQRAVELTFDYYLVENDQVQRKLAHGKHKMAWMGRGPGGIPVALDLPANVVHALRASP